MLCGRGGGQGAGDGVPDALGSFTRSIVSGRLVNLRLIVVLERGRVTVELVLGRIGRHGCVWSAGCALF